jgi:hypothetical protein
MKRHTRPFSPLPASRPGEGPGVRVPDLQTSDRLARVAHAIGARQGPTFEAGNRRQKEEIWLEVSVNR